MGQLDLALIGNCQISALIDKAGSYVWACFPRFDSPAVFASLLGTADNGIWSVQPENRDGETTFETRQSYMGNTNVLQTEFHLSNGDRFDVIDFCPRFWRWGGYYRAPYLIRIIRRVKGQPRIKMILKPRPDYGRETPDAVITDRGIVYSTDTTKLHFHSNLSSTYVMEERAFGLQEDIYCVLAYGEPFPMPLKFRCEEFLERTRDYWTTWVRHCYIPAEYQEPVIRSALALKLHIFEDTGAITAATTTSIPEGPEGGRCWDYRYCWLRDAYFTINALMQLGHFEEMEAFINFLQNRASFKHGPKLQPVYKISGERNIEERFVPWLKGFRGIGPVRVGNHAYTHHQHDVYGEMVLAIAPVFFDQRLDRLDKQSTFESITKLVEHSIKIFDMPDAGIWEFRSEERHYVFSKLLCWAALDRGVKIAAKMRQGEAFERWLPVLKRMRATIEDEAWNRDLGYYTQTLKGQSADASNLLMTHLNFHEPGHPRLKSMVDQYQKILTERGYVFRYKNADDFGVPQHAFTICNYWMIDALAGAGRVAEARAIFETLLTHRNHVGLLSEDIDPESGELWGNFPQTYSHVGLINSALRISKSWSELI